MKSYLKIDYLNIDMVRIHAHLCADGNLYEKIERRSPSSKKTGRTDKPFKRYILEYTNTQPELLDEMSTAIENVAPLTYIYRGNYRVQARNKLLYLLMRQLGCGKSFEWSIPEEIVNTTLFRRAWLAAFFDDEGSITKAGIFLYSSHEEGILQVKKMLEFEGIKLSLYKRNLKNSLHPGYAIRIRAESYSLFISLIQFIHPKKKIAYNKYYSKNRCPIQDFRVNPNVNCAQRFGNI